MHKSRSAYGCPTFTGALQEWDKAGGGTNSYGKPVPPTLSTVQRLGVTALAKPAEESVFEPMSLGSPPPFTQLSMPLAKCDAATMRHVWRFT